MSGDHDPYVAMAVGGLPLNVFANGRKWWGGVGHARPEMLCCTKLRGLMGQDLKLFMLLEYRLNFFIQPSFTWYDGWLATVPDAPLPLHFIGGASVAHILTAQSEFGCSLSAVQVAFREALVHAPVGAGDGVQSQLALAAAHRHAVVQPAHAARPALHRAVEAHRTARIRHLKGFNEILENQERRWGRERTVERAGVGATVATPQLLTSTAIRLLAQIFRHVFPLTRAPDDGGRRVASDRRHVRREVAAALIHYSRRLGPVSCRSRAGRRRARRPALTRAGRAPTRYSAAGSAMTRRDVARGAEAAR
ncbi:hypothetical protein EVAR_382_1 [Eumeta japonica]|uniref:Uncharacterized protein n=1 Tax=Eumeta variegata TaxID=151549 RepID=A0A4C1SB01_EUMVA|nr:hypothetical protein EVAR_382_1 [Eumeta japonica]